MVRVEAVLALSIAVAGCSAEPDIHPTSPVPTPSIPTSSPTPTEAPRFAYLPRSTPINAAALEPSTAAPPVPDSTAAAELAIDSHYPPPSEILTYVHRGEPVVASMQNMADTTVRFDRPQVNPEALELAKNATMILNNGAGFCSAVVTHDGQGQISIPGVYHCLRVVQETGLPTAGFVGHARYRWFATEVESVIPEFDFARVRLLGVGNEGMTSVPSATTDEINDLVPNSPFVVVNYQRGERAEPETIYDTSVTLVGMTEARLVVAWRGAGGLAKGGSMGGVFVPQADGSLKAAGVLSILLPHGSDEYRHYESILGFSPDPSFHLAEFTRVDADR